MNWKTIDENWHRYSYENQIDLTKSMRSYFYGILTIYKAKENFESFKIIYENKLNKSGEGGSSYGIGHKIMLCGVITCKQNLELKIIGKSFWKRFKSRNGSLNIKCNIASIERILPLHQIEQLLQVFPDVKIKIKKFDQYRNQDIPFGQPVIFILSKRQPQKLEHLNLFRDLMLSILIILEKHGYID